MNDDDPLADSSEMTSPAVGTRWPEIGMAAFLLVLAVLVIIDSLRVGNGWAEDGPQSGYFPFYIGSILLGASLVILLTQLWRFNRHNPPFAQRHQLRLVLLVLGPLIAYVAQISLLGIYVASFALIVHFMLVHGRYKVLPTFALAVAVPLIAYGMFERWFHVLLPGTPPMADLWAALTHTSLGWDKLNLTRAAVLLSLAWLAKDLYGRLR
ncbi:MAG: tripartite tricarboxylate transporter TctB family protein [Pseudomonadota bacterium]